MPKKPDTKRPPVKTPNRHRSRLAIAGVVLAVVAFAVLLVLSSLRSSPGNRPGAPANNSSSSDGDGRARQVLFEVVNSYPHDPTSFTQGLLWHDGGFYESTGLNGQSKLRRLEFPAGRVLKEVALPADLFGEGLAMIDSRLIQLTWTSHRGFVYDRDSFRLLQEFRYDTEGWGLTYDGTSLILSDGSSDLFYLDPQTFKQVGKLAVTMNGQPVRELNELEFIEGEIWSNVWQRDLILRIDPSTGKVTSFLNLKGILAPSDRTGSEDVLNGIAYDPERKRIFVTGKLWPRIFEIRVR
ncbi:MAG TPA: glutaminyl-peptide cyclotransferase [Blastocatellia bacterium]|nr:glutaminyl-peptide cyclotransferase [Blastocatellia bacterium]